LIKSAHDVAGMTDGATKSADKAALLTVAKEVAAEERVIGGFQKVSAAPPAKKAAPAAPAAKKAPAAPPAKKAPAAPPAKKAAAASMKKTAPAETAAPAKAAAPAKTAPPVKTALPTLAAAESKISKLAAGGVKKDATKMLQSHETMLQKEAQLAKADLKALKADEPSLINDANKVAKMPSKTLSGMLKEAMRDGNSEKGKEKSALILMAHEVQAAEKMDQQLLQRIQKVSGAHQSKIKPQGKPSDKILPVDDIMNKVDHRLKRMEKKS